MSLCNNSFEQQPCPYQIELKYKKHWKQLEPMSGRKLLCWMGFSYYCAFTIVLPDIIPFNLLHRPAIWEQNGNILKR